jgi:hypothetical protein
MMIKKYAVALLIVVAIVAGSLSLSSWIVTSVRAEPTNPNLPNIFEDAWRGPVGNPVAVQDTGSSLFSERAALQSLQLRKTVGLDAAVCPVTNEITVGPGTAVTYCFEVTNTGPITVSHHGLTDSHLGAILGDFAYSLAPGASAFLTQTQVLTETTVNTAMWTAYNPGPTDVVTATDIATVTVASPSISLRKTVGVDASVCGTMDELTVPKDTPVTYCFEVTNTGPTTVSRHDLTDSHLGTLLDDFAYSLAPGASAFLTQTQVLTVTTVNTATWVAYNPGPSDVPTATDVATVIIEKEGYQVYLPFVLKP